MKTGGRLIKHARYSLLLLAESVCTVACLVRCFDSTFVVSRTGEGYDAQVRGPSRKFRFVGLVPGSR